MRSTYYPGVCTKPGTYYQGWFMYMRYTQGQNEEYLLSRSVQYVLNKVLTKQVPLYCTSMLVYAVELCKNVCESATHTADVQDDSCCRWSSCAHCTQVWMYTCTGREACL